jgi:hypothetical protein
MNNTYKKSTQRIYKQPLIERVIIDNDISLTLDSYSGPGDEPLVLSTDLFSRNPFKTELV